MQNVLNQLKHVLKTNNTTILCSAGVVGTVSTAYLTGKASWEASRIVQASEKEGGMAPTFTQRMKERVPLVWRLYVPASISGALTVGAVVGATKIGNKHTAAALGAYSLTERAFSEYRGKVVDQIGENKERKIRDELAQEAVSRKPPTDVVILADGDVLCCELYTGRYFKTSVETLKQAVNEVNFEMMNGVHYYSLAEFYYKVGLDITSSATDMGWDSDRLMEISITSTLTPDDKPCLAFEYNYVKPLL